MDRRDLLKGLAALPIAGAPGAGRPAREEITAATIGEAARLLGLEFDEAERTRIANAAPGALEAFKALRANPLPNGLPPVLVFRPAGIISGPARAGTGVQALPAEEIGRPADDTDLAFLPVHALARLIQARKVSSTELTKLALARLKDRDPELHCVVTLTERLALEQAARADAELAAGRSRGPLHGIPYGLKDLFAVKGYPTTWGAKPLRDQVIDEDCAVYTALSAAGAVLVAKLSLGALAMGDLWFGGRTRNPWNVEQGSSGSSAGSAASVAAGLLPFALGTETLGSIVSPCTRCGANGLRPTFGRVSRHGAMTLSWSMDKVGPIARDVRDLALVFAAIHGRDPRDPSTFEAPFDFDPRAPARDVRVGFVEREFEGERAAADREVLGVLRTTGHDVRPVVLPAINAAPLRFLLEVEAAAAFDAFTRDGSVKGLDGQAPNDWPDLFRKARFVPAVEYLQANRRRATLLDAWEELFTTIDVLVTPSQRGGTLLPTNLTGHPACVLPNGFGARGPTSITFVAGFGDEGRLLETACRYQEATSWHLRRPPD